MRERLEIQSLNVRQIRLRKAGYASLVAGAILCTLVVQFLPLKSIAAFPGIHIPKDLESHLPSTVFHQLPSLTLVGEIKWLVGRFYTLSALYLVVPALFLGVVLRRWMLCVAAIALYGFILFGADVMPEQLNKPKVFLSSEATERFVNKLSGTEDDDLQLDYVRLQLGKEPISRRLSESLSYAKLESLEAVHLYELTGRSEIFAGCSRWSCWDYAHRRMKFAGYSVGAIMLILSGIFMLIVSEVQNNRLRNVRLIEAQRLSGASHK